MYIPIGRIVRRWSWIVALSWIFFCGLGIGLGFTLLIGDWSLNSQWFLWPLTVKITAMIGWLAIICIVAVMLLRKREIRMTH